jgi:hypothetical protein
LSSRIFPTTSEELEELLVDEPGEELRVAVRRSDEAIDRRGPEIAELAHAGLHGCRPLPRGRKPILDQFGQGGEGQWEVVLAASVIATVPMLVIFFLGQRYFVEGIATTGRKR